jgi:hypothetical protein
VRLWCPTARKTGSVGRESGAGRCLRASATSYLIDFPDRRETRDRATSGARARHGRPPNCARGQRRHAARLRWRRNASGTTTLTTDARRAAAACGALRRRRHRRLFANRDSRTASAARPQFGALRSGPSVPPAAAAQRAAVALDDDCLIGNCVAAAHIDNLDARERQVFGFATRKRCPGGFDQRTSRIRGPASLEPRDRRQPCSSETSDASSVKAICGCVGPPNLALFDRQEPTRWSH